MNQLQNLTRVGGVLYVILIACGMYAEIFVLSELVTGNDQTTASNILSHETLYRTGIIAHTITLLCSSFLLGILYKIFKSTSEYLVLTLFILNTVTIAIEGVSILYEFETLSILKSKILAGSFSADQISAMAFLPLRIQTTGYDLALLFFGFECCVISHLILRSKLFLRWVGILMFVAGVCYITNTLVSFISPGFRNQLLPFILIPCFIAELSLGINMVLSKGFISEKPA